MNFPLLTVAIALLLTIFSKIPLGIAQGRESGGYDNKQPREQQARLSGWGKRALAAHQNSFEAFAPFAAAVLATQITHANPLWTARLCALFIGARILYNILYLADWDKLRSLAWFVGFGSILALFSLSIF